MNSIEPEDARQGKTGKPVLRVLIAALALCVVGAFGMATYAWMMPDQTLDKATTEEGGVTTPPGAQSSAQDPAAPKPAGTAPAATQPATSN